MERIRTRILILVAFAPLASMQACSGEESGANPAGGSSVSAAAPVEAVAANLVRADFDVVGMDCGGCVIGTRAALRKLEGVENADASYDDATGKGTAWAMYDPAKVTPERMMAAIRELGYTPTPVPSES